MVNSIPFQEMITIRNGLKNIITTVDILHLSLILLSFYKFSISYVAEELKMNLISSIEFAQASYFGLLYSL
jgi:hypothetical protein